MMTTNAYLEYTSRYERSAEDLMAERAMMGTPRRWPYPTRLSLKRAEAVDARDPRSRFGTLCVTDEAGVQVVLPAVFAYDGRLLAEYPSFEALQRDGWVID